jgi:hypothetical protein
MCKCYGKRSRYWGRAIEKSDTPTPDGFSGVIMEVLDNGEPGQTVDDQFNFFIVPNPGSFMPLTAIHQWLGIGRSR